MSTIEHGALTRPGARAPLRLVELPDWHGWRYKSLPARVVRWLEEHVRIPTGHGAGDPIRLAGFQRQIVRTLYESTSTVVSLPAGNGKTTLLAALALERICRGDDYVEVDVVATKEDQAKILVEAAKRMVEASPALVPLCAYSSNTGVLDYRLTGSRIAAQPAKLSAVQGLNFSVAIVDEIGFASDEVVSALMARLGKRPDATLIGIGTPGLEVNVMHRLRERQDELGLVGFRYLEWAAPAGCELTDRAAWRKANPALRAGFLRADALAVQVSTMTEAEFRTYHLGQWVTGMVAHWLPPGTWDACPHADPPPEDTEVVLALSAHWKHSVAIAGATLDGAVFLAWGADRASDGELVEVLQRAAARWRVVRVVVPSTCRPGLVERLREELPVEIWPRRNDLEVSSATEWRRAVLEGRVAHDHDPMLGEHIAASVARPTTDGSLRLVGRDDATPVDAARAARMAWWSAQQAPMVELEEPAIF